MSIIAKRHAGRTVTFEEADSTYRIYDEDSLISEVARTATLGFQKGCPVRRPPGQGSLSGCDEHNICNDRRGR